MTSQALFLICIFICKQGGDADNWLKIVTSKILLSFFLVSVYDLIITISGSFSSVSGQPRTVRCMYTGFNNSNLPILVQHMYK